MLTLSSPSINDDSTKDTSDRKHERDLSERVISCHFNSVYATNRGLAAYPLKIAVCAATSLVESAIRLKSSDKTVCPFIQA
tara:strand:- start:3070 stop:3312 length:243 start_codon:yes stop_codon:yes gene_type:complete